MHPLSNRVNTILAAQRTGRTNLILPASETIGGNSQRTKSLLKILVREGFLDSFSTPFYTNEVGTVVSTLEVQDQKVKIQGQETHISLKYGPKGEPAIRNRYCICKPSRTYHLRSASFWKGGSGTGICILSTPFGLLTDREARQRNVGGVPIRAVR